MGKDVVTTQQTGKGVKASKALGVILLGAGIYKINSDPDSAGLLLVGGVVLYIGASVIGWWRYR